MAIKENKNPDFSPGHHAMIYALYVRNINKSDLPDSKKYIQNTIVRYAVQRGERMAKRVLADNKELTIENYLSYGEWISDDSIEISVLNKKPIAITRVTKCPWFTEWSKFGYLPEGESYCSHIDINLVRGFNNKLNIGINSNLSNGNEFCEFHWYEADYDLIEDIPKEKRIKPWSYHMAHLYYTIKEINGHIPLLIENINKDFNTLYGIDLDAALSGYKNVDFTII